MEDQPTCGKGLAEHAALPAKLAELTVSVADNLEIHMNTLDLRDENARQEYDAYRALVEQHRETAARLQRTADQMSGYRDLPMGRHDPEAMSDPRVSERFERFVKLEEELLALLQQRVRQDREMLSEFGRGASQG